MSLFDTQHKRKSLAITTVLMALLILLLFLAGLKYMDPPIENGIAINFGTDNVGSGYRKPPPPPAKSEPKEVETPPKEVTPPEPVEEKISEPKEEVLTQETEESVVVPKEKKKEKVVKKEKKEKKPEKKSPEQPKKEEVKQKEEPKPSKATTDALSNILGASKSKDGNTEDGQGDDNKQGYKGNPEGSPYANSYYGAPGSGTGGKGWGLSGRSLVSGGKVTQDCNESGKVVVQIEVDRNGKVVKATPGVRGTTNNAPCLLEPARKTALMHRWNVDRNAPERQIGFIEINFRLGE